MRAKVIRPFHQIVKEGKPARAHRKGDVITVTKKDFEQLGFYLSEVPETTKLTPMRDADGKCTPCNQK